MPPARSRREAWCLRAVALAGPWSVACSDAVAECRSIRCQSADIHVATWWAGTDGGAGAWLAERAESNLAVGEVVWSQFPTRPALVAAMDAMLTGAGPPPVDAMMVNGGPDVLRWASCGAGGTPSLLMRLDDLYRGLQAAYAPPVLRGIECAEGGLYAMPLGMHRINHVFYNRERVAACSSDAVRDVSSLVDWFRCLKGEADATVVALPTVGCVAECDDSGSPECVHCERTLAEPAQFLLENVVLLGGRERYEAAPSELADPCLSPQDGALGSALDDLSGELRPFVNNCGGADCAPTDLAGAASQVADGRAALLVMPDWYHPGDVPWQGQWDHHVEQAPFPGTQDSFAFTLDAFAVPAPSSPEAALRREASMRWLDVLLDPQDQRYFVRKKKATPALAALQDASLAQQLLPSLDARLTSAELAAHLRSALLAWLRAGRKPLSHELLAAAPMDCEQGAEACSCP